MTIANPVFKSPSTTLIGGLGAVPPKTARQTREAELMLLNLVRDTIAIRVFRPARQDVDVIVLAVLV